MHGEFCVPENQWDILFCQCVGNILVMSDQLFVLHNNGIAGNRALCDFCSICVLQRSCQCAGVGLHHEFNYRNIVTRSSFLDCDQNIQEAEQCNPSKSTLHCLNTVLLPLPEMGGNKTCNWWKSVCLKSQYGKTLHFAK